MASVGSLPFMVETKAETYGILLSKNQHRPSSSSAACRPKMLPVFAVFKNSTSGFSLCFDKRGHLSSIKHVKAAGKGYSEGESGNESEDSLQATIEKSKKVLAMQKQLFQPISERRKLVSSAKSDIANSEEDEVSYEQRENSFSDLDPASASGSNVVENQIGSIPSSSYVLLTADAVPEILSSAVIRDPDVDGKESESRLPPEKASFNIDSPKQLKDSEEKASFKVDSPKRWKDSKETASFNKDSPKKLKDSKEKVSFNINSTNQLKESNEKASFNIDSAKQLKDSNEKALFNLDSSKQLKDSNEKATFNVDSPKQLKDSNPKAAWSDKLPSFLSHATEISCPRDEQHEKDLKSVEFTSKATDANIEDAKPPPLAGANVMNVILVAAECAPWSKTGGLGDVAGALPKALARRGHRVMVVAPLYGNYAEPQDTGIRKRYRVDRQDMEVAYFQAYIDGVDFVFIESPIFRHIENNIYGGGREDILKRMVLFCKAAVEVPWYVPCGGACYGDGNLVFIANDWHTALLPVYLKAYYRDNGLMMYTRSLLVIHNIAHQGRGPVTDFNYADLPEHYIELFKLNDPVGGEHFNIFAAGLKTADRVVTVSHGYSRELKTTEGGWGLHNIINEVDWKLNGIVNGIDTKEWSPENDVHLTSDGYTNYSLDTLHTGKPQCKAALQKEFDLPVHEDVPVIGFIGRLDHQKGVDLIAEAIPWMMGQDVQLVMLGTGRHDLEGMLRHFENRHHDKVRGWVGFSVKTAHRITAGADILLMPSRFEPCGLNQLYAMNYGTIPVVHAVGGLRDTVQPFDPLGESGLGWTFDSAETHKLIQALGNCLLTYHEYKKSWEGLQRRGMMQDLSWDNAAQKYEDILVAAKYQW